MLSDEEVKGVLAKGAEARRLFPPWWERFGKKFETLLQTGLTRKEAASYAFVAGYVAGRDKTRREGEE